MASKKDLRSPTAPKPPPRHSRSKSRGEESEGETNTKQRMEEEDTKYGECEGDEGTKQGLELRVWQDGEGRAFEEDRGTTDSRAENQAFPSLKIFSNVQEIHNYRLDPFKRKNNTLLGVAKKQLKCKRVVTKRGKINTQRQAHQKQVSVILKDLFISAIQMSWYWNIFNFVASYVFSWLFFAIIWYLIAYFHGDFNPETNRPTGHQVCVENVEDFTTSFLFSIETQHTIGYGGRATTSQCPLAILVMSFQSIVGVFIEACMTGIVFAKFTKPTHRAKTIIFSDNALITLRNGTFYLLCRVGDLRPTHLIESHISAYMLRGEVTEEGEEIPHHLFAIEFGTDLDGTQDFFQLFWPIVLSHRIDEKSPLWSFSPQDLLTEQFEIILTMEGTTPETGNNIQVRTSYLPNEIMWGYKFEHSCVSFNNEIGKYQVSFETMNKIKKDTTPCMSPKDYSESRRVKEVQEREDEDKVTTVNNVTKVKDKVTAPCLNGEGASPIAKTVFSKARTKNKARKTEL